MALLMRTPTATAIATLITTVALLQQMTHAAVYKVGDSAGWTTIGNVDYKIWSSTKTFQVGDVIQFIYNPQFHNVLQVTHAMFRACNASVPIESHSTGNDSITIKSRGHHYFICGVPGHCQSGQKFDINVPRDAVIAPTPALYSPPPSASAPAPALAPAPNMAASLKSRNSTHFSLFGLFVVCFLVSL